MANNFPQEITTISTGVDTSDATATASQVVSNYTAYAKRQKIVGTLILPNYTAEWGRISIYQSATLNTKFSRKQHTLVFSAPINTNSTG